MKRFLNIVFAIISIISLTGCNNPLTIEESHNELKKETIIDNNVKAEEFLDDSKEELFKGIDIDRTEYLTGEIITDGLYEIVSPGDFSTLRFIPDKESLEIMADKYREKQYYLLAYDDLEIVKELPKDLGIYKVKVKIEKVDDYGYLFIDTIKLTDNIGTILYEGKTFKTNDLDDTVNIKDKVCGLIVDRVTKANGGIVVGFAGEIICEGYYTIDPKDNDMFGPTGHIYVDKEYEVNFPTIYGESNEFSVWFSKTNNVFDDLANHSLFGRGKFKTSGYYLIYNYGIGNGPGEIITEIMSLDENYSDMFNFEENKYIEIRCVDDDFSIVSLTEHDNDYNNISTDYYYINNKTPDKIHLFTSDRYAYTVKEKINEYEFTLSTDGFNMSTGNTEIGHNLICKITEQGTAVVNKVEDTFSDENYNNLFELDTNEVLRLIEDRDDYIIVSIDKIDEESNIKSSDYFYISKNSHNKEFLFTTDEFNYHINVIVNENELILSTKMALRNEATDRSHSFICKITEQGAIIEKVDDLNIDRDKLDDSGSGFNVQGYIEEINLKDNILFISLKDIKMKEEDALAFGKSINKDDSIDIQIIDNNRSGPVINAGDMIMLFCRYTNDKEIIYTYGADINSKMY